MLIAFLLTDSSELDPAGFLVCVIQDLAHRIYWIVCSLQDTTQPSLTTSQFFFFRIEKLLRYWSALYTPFMNLLYWTTAQFLYSYIGFSAFSSHAHHFWHVDHACHSRRSVIFTHLNHYITFLQNDGCRFCFWLPVLGCGMRLFTSVMTQPFLSNKILTNFTLL